MAAKLKKEGKVLEEVSKEITTTVGDTEKYGAKIGDIATVFPFE